MRLFWICFVSLTFLLTLNCSTTSVNDSLVKKDYSMLFTYQKALQKSSTDKNADLKSSLLGKKENSVLESCQDFYLLSQNEFILKDVARLRALLVCPATSENYLNLIVQSTEEPKTKPWLKDLYLKVSLKNAEVASDKKLKAWVFYEQARASARVSEKVELYQRSQQIYNELSETQKNDEVQRALDEIAPHLIAQPLKSDWLRAGKSAVAFRLFNKARKYFLQILKDPSFSFEDQYRARVELRDSYKVEQDLVKHLEQAGKLVLFLEKKKDPKKLFEARVFYARALWTQGKVPEAEKQLRRSVKIKSKTIFSLSPAFWILGRMQEEKKNYSQAVSYYDQGLLENPPPDQLEQLLYYKAWSFRKLKKFKQAIPVFVQLAEKTINDKNRFLFWQAQSIKQAGLPGAEDLFRKIADEDILGYYGILAHRELKIDFAPLPIHQGKSLKAPTKIDSYVQKYIEALSVVGERDILERYVYLNSHKSNSDTDPDSWLYFLKAYAKSGLYLRLFAEIPKLTPDVRKKILLDDPELIFPRDYYSLIEAQAQKFQVSPEFVLAIIRQESAFDPYSRSSVDALGLMQLMPDLDRELLKETQIQIRDYTDLFEPQTNITLGTLLISKLFKKYQGQFLLTAASYNANDKAIRGWVRSRFDGDVLEFIEDVPYSETRAYMKLVLRNFIFYSRLKTPEVSIPFPEWCLENLQSFKNSTSAQLTSH